MNSSTCHDTLRAFISGVLVLRAGALEAKLYRRGAEVRV